MNTTENTDNKNETRTSLASSKPFESLWINPNGDVPLHQESEDFSIGGGKWGGSGRLGTGGGTVTWSLPGAGHSDRSGGGFFSGATVAFGSIVNFDYLGAIERVFETWSSVANINFRQVSDGGGDIGVGKNANIRIAAGYIDGDSGFNTLASAYLPNSGNGTSSQSALSGDVVMDSGQNWTPKLFFLTMLHEVGHSLGLSHSNTTSIMSSTINTSLNGLQPDDVAGIREVYGVRKGGDVPTNGNRPTSGDDNFRGTASSDSVNLLGGNDRYIAGNGADLVHGGTGNDELFGQNGKDRLFGDGGNDRLYGGGQDDVLRGGNGNDRMSGGDGVDRLFGDAGNDTLHGGSGADVLFGAGQNDLIVGGNGNDRAYGEEGIDRLVGGAGNDTLNGGDGADLLFGAGQNDVLVGGTGNDRAYGGDGVDRLLGSAGNDLLNGGDGRDFLYGQSGNDRLIGGAGNDQLSSGSGNDLIIVHNGWGHDRVTDFSVVQDVLNMRQVTGVDSINDLSFGQTGGDLLLRYGTNSIRLERLNLSDVDDLAILL